MSREWLSYGSDTKRVVTAFVIGVNEYVRLTEEDPDPYWAFGSFVRTREQALSSESSARR